MALIPEPISWGSFTAQFLDELTHWIDGKKVLEIFAGNGLLASKLAERDVDIKSTSLFRGHDGHDAGMFYEVEELEASAAVVQYGKDRDVLLMSWPVAEETALKASLRWDFEKPIIFIGEVTDYDRGHLGGCASDLFFDLTEETHVFKHYSPRNVLERAAVRKLDKEAILKWAKRPPIEEPAAFRF